MNNFFIKIMIWVTICITSYPGFAENTTAIPNNVRNFVENKWPDPGLLVYMPIPAKGSGKWRNLYDSGLQALKNNQFPRAAVAFREAAESIKGTDYNAELFSRFAAGSSFLLAQNYAEAVLDLRRSVGTLKRKHKGGSLRPWYDMPIAKSDLHTYHVYHNLVVAYLAAGPNAGPKVGNPWQRGELKRDYNGRTTLHTSWLKQHQQNENGTPVHLAFANSNLDRIFQDNSNESNSPLLRYTSAKVLLALGDDEGMAIFEQLAKEGVSEKIPVRSLKKPVQILNGQQIQEHIFADIYHYALLKGDADQVAEILPKIKQNKEQAELVLAAVKAGMVFQQVEKSNVIDTDLKKAAEQSIQEVQSNRGLNFLQTDAEKTQAQLTAKTVVPVIPTSDVVLAWLKKNGLWMILASIFLVGSVWIRLRWATWNNNVYYWRRLNYCSTRPDHDFVGLDRQAKPSFDRPE